MATIEMTSELKGTNVRYYSPFRVAIKSENDFKEITGKKPTTTIKKAMEIIANGGINVSLKKQESLKNLGFNKFFRGFNSHSGDMYIYQNSSGDWYFSIGVANVNKAGLGYQIKIN